MKNTIFDKSDGWRRERRISVAFSAIKIFHRITTNDTQKNIIDTDSDLIIFLAALFLLGNHLKYIVQQIQLRVENRYKTKRSADYNRIEDNRRGNMLTPEPKSELGSPRGELRRTGNNWVDDKGKASRVLLVRGSREKFIDFIGGDVVSG